MRESELVSAAAGMPARQGAGFHVEAPLPIAATARTLACTEADWANVHVREVEVARRTGTDDSYLDIRADVYLGRLLPADVKVELVESTPATHGNRSGPRRLWSLFSYHNRSYAFGTSVPQGVLERGEGWAIRVTPAAEPSAGVTLAPIVSALRQPTFPAGP